MKKLLGLLSVMFLFSLSTNAISTPKLFVGVVTEKPVYRTNETIAMALTVLNQNFTSAKVTFTSGKKYDFYLSKNDQAIWKWSNGMMFTMVLSEMTLKPKEPLTYVVTCHMGQQLEPGRYKLVGAFCTKEKEYLSEPAEIEIR